MSQHPLQRQKQDKYFPLFLLSRFASSNVSARFSIVSLYLSLKHQKLVSGSFWLDDPGCQSEMVSYQVKSDLLEFGDSVVLSPRRIDPRADKAGRPFWFFTVGVDSLAMRYELNRCTDAVTIRPSGRVFAENYILVIFKGSSDPSHFLFEINVGKRRIRHRTTVNSNEIIFNRYGNSAFNFRVVICRIRPFPTLTWKNEMAWVWSPKSLDYH